jgi:hypothetical protein
MAINSRPINLSSEASIAYDILRELDMLVKVASQVGFTAAIGVFDSQAPSANGLSVVTTTLYAQSADATHPGMVNTTTQTFSGAKTFSTSISTPTLTLTSAGAATSVTTGTMTTNLTGLGVITITPTGDSTFNATGGYAGQYCSFVITTSGVTSFNLTFGTNFKSAGVLATGTSSGKVFSVSFVNTNGTSWVETSRTTAL